MFSWLHKMRGGENLCRKIFVLEILIFPFVGIIRIRFNGYNLSPIITIEHPSRNYKTELVKNSSPLIRKFHQISFYECINVPIHHCLDIRSLKVGTMVFHSAVIKNVATNL
jgi:hypothetical protein